jgi:hypothetical protein
MTLQAQTEGRAAKEGWSPKKRKGEKDIRNKSGLRS